MFYGYLLFYIIDDGECDTLIIGIYCLTGDCTIYIYYYLFGDNDWVVTADPL